MPVKGIDGIDIVDNQETDRRKDENDSVIQNLVRNFLMAVLSLWSYDNSVRQSGKTSCSASPKAFMSLITIFFMLICVLLPDLAAFFLKFIVPFLKKMCQGI